MQRPLAPVATKSVKMADRGRQGVTHGGMWNTAKAQYSTDTQQLLKDMMKESRLTNFQQRQLDKAMKDGATLPATVNPTTSAKQRAPRQQKEPSKIINPKTHVTRLKTKDDIEATGAYERDQYAPAPQTKYGGKYEKDKERLANIMAFGEDLAPPDWKEERSKVDPEPTTYKRVDRFDELQAEIDERRNFLKDMESLGQGHKYRTIIETEVSQKIREMELIDQKRTSELHRMLDQR